MGYKVANLRVLVAKAETTPGTAETLTDADFNVRIMNPEVTPTVEIDDESSKFATGDHGEDEAITGAQSGKIGFSIKLNPGVDGTTAPNWVKFAQACGMEKRVWGSTGISLEPQKSADASTMTMWVMDIDRGGAPSALVYKFAGCSGTWELGCEGIGKPLVGKFSFDGKLEDISDMTNAGILDLTSPDAILPNKLLSTTMKINNVTQKISTFKMTAGNKVDPLIDQGEATGYETYGITSRKPRFSCNPLTELAATDDVYDRWLDGTTGAIAVDLGEISLNIPRAQLLTATLANREGLVGWEQNYKCLRNGSDNTNMAQESAWELLFGSKA